MNGILEFAGYSAGYGKTDVLKQLDLTLYAGEVTVLIGSNGCGKTTLLRCAAGLLKGRGTCLRMGEKADFSPRGNARFAAYLAQQGGTDLNMNVMDFMVLGLNGKKGDLTAAAEEALGRFGCAELAEKDFTLLSGGQKQLVRLSALTLRRTRMILLDEPDSALDISNRGQILSYFRDRAKETGESVLMSCHDVNAALAYADRLVFLKEGTVTADVRPAQADAPSLQAAFDAVFPGTELVRHEDRFLIMPEVRHEA